MPSFSAQGQSVQMPMLLPTIVQQLPFGQLTAAWHGRQHCAMAPAGCMQLSSAQQPSGLPAQIACSPRQAPGSPSVALGGPLQTSTRIFAAGAPHTQLACSSVMHCCATQ